MALRILILVCSLTVPAEKPSHGDTIPIGQLDLLSCKSFDVSPADSPSYPLAGPSCKPWPARGRFHSLAGCLEDLLSSPRSLSDCEDDESEVDIQAATFAVRQVGEIDPAISLLFPVRPFPLAARFSSWRLPLRC